MKNLFFHTIALKMYYTQQWNQLSRFQKNLVVVIIFAGILLCGFLLYQRQLLKSEIFEESVDHVRLNNADKIQIIPFKVSLLLYLSSKNNINRDYNHSR